MSTTQAQPNGNVISGCRLTAAGTYVVQNGDADLGNRLIKLGSAMIDGYALADVLSLAFPNDVKTGAALCVEILSDEIEDDDG